MSRRSEVDPSRSKDAPTRSVVSLSLPRNRLAMKVPSCMASPLTCGDTTIPGQTENGDPGQIQ